MNPSLLLIPDRYKASKLYSQIPDSGAGDLAFTRALDTATRVNSAGLIEKVRTNQVLQSETLNDAYWLKLNVSITANAIANPLNGALTADLLTVTDPTGPVEKTIVTDLTQSFTAGTPYTASAYFKAGSISTNFRILAFDGTSLYQSGVIDLATIGNSTALYEDVGGGWYRFRFTFTPANTTAVGFVYLVNYAFGVAANAGTNVFIYGAQIETGDIATPYIPTTTAAVSVGPVADIPRIDYTGGGCGKLLLEPQRTNLLTFSEQMNNAAWDKINATVTANTSVSPDGTQSADTVVITSGGYLYREILGYSAVSGQSAAISVFANNQTANFLIFGGATPAGTDVYKIENYGDGWYRHSVVRTFTTTTTGTLQYLTAYLIVGTHIVWGAQAEAGSYATSYIPTTSATVTRGADIASKTGISSLIGQTEGTIYGEFANPAQAANGRYFSLSNGTASDRIDVYAVSPTSIGLFAAKSFVVIINTSFAVPANAPFKYAIAYKAGQWAWYLNGVQIATSADTNVPIMSAAQLSTDPAGGIAAEGSPLNAAAIYTTRLSNSELAQLTTL